MKIFSAGAILLSILFNMLPAHALDKFNTTRGTTISMSPFGQKALILAQAANVSVQGTRKDEIIKKSYMETTFGLNSAGRLTARTKTWTNVKLKGFTGGVYIVFVDASGSPVWNSEQQRYGVDGTMVGKSDRTENWSANVPPEIRSQIKGYAIVHEYTPRSRVMDWVNSPQGRELIKGAVQMIGNN